MHEQLSWPAEQLVEAQGTITVCSRHGRTAARRADFPLQSRPRLTGSRWNSGNVLATAGRIAEHRRKVRFTRLSDWPLCGVCVRERRIFVTLAGLLFWGGLVALVGGLVAGALIGAPSPSLGYPLLGGFAAMLLAPWAFVLGSMPRLLGARTSDDGTQVVFFRPHPRFAAQLESDR